jgi:hypothetical protein
MATVAYGVLVITAVAHSNSMVTYVFSPLFERVKSSLLVGLCAHFNLILTSGFNDMCNIDCVSSTSLVQVQEVITFFIQFLLVTIIFLHK